MMLSTEAIISFQVMKPDPPVPPTPVDPIEEQVLKKLGEIENRFKDEIVSTLELDPPYLVFPSNEIPGWQTTDVAGVWVRTKNRYEYAQKNNELSAKFGRIQPIIAELEPLTKRYPGSPTLKRTLAYFYTILDNWKEALQNYQAAALQSEASYDWFDVASVRIEIE